MSSNQIHLIFLSITLKKEVILEQKIQKVEKFSKKICKLFVRKESL